MKTIIRRASEELIAWWRYSPSWIVFTEYVQSVRTIKSWRVGKFRALTANHETTKLSYSGVCSEILYEDLGTIPAMRNACVCDLHCPRLISMTWHDQNWYNSLILIKTSKPAWKHFEQMVTFIPFSALPDRLTHVRMNCEICSYPFWPSEQGNVDSTELLIWHWIPNSERMPRKGFHWSFKITHSSSKLIWQRSVMMDLDSI